MGSGAIASNAGNCMASVFGNISDDKEARAQIIFSFSRSAQGSRALSEQDHTCDFSPAHRT